MGTLILVKQNSPYLWINLLSLISLLCALYWPHAKENRINCKLPEQICLNPWSSKSYIYISYLRQVGFATPSSQKVTRNFLYSLRKNSSGPQTWINSLHTIPSAWRKGEEDKQLAEKIRGARWESEREQFQILMNKFRFRWILLSAYFRDWHMAYAADGQAAIHVQL